MGTSPIVSKEPDSLKPVLHDDFLVESVLSSEILNSIEKNAINYAANLTTLINKLQTSLCQFSFFYLFFKICLVRKLKKV